MKIETKANVGDTVFYIFHNKVCSSDVQYVNIHISNEKRGAMAVEAIKVEVKYKVCHSDNVLESNIYTSKEELAQAVLDGKL